MEKLIKNLIDAIKTNRKGLQKLKNAAMTCHQIDLDAEVRKIENEYFPETKQIKAEKERADKLRLLFSMVELNISPGTCWLIDQTLKMHQKKKGKFSIMDAVELKLKKEDIFFYEQDFDK